MSVKVVRESLRVVKCEVSLVSESMMLVVGVIITGLSESLLALVVGEGMVAEAEKIVGIGEAEGS